MVRIKHSGKYERMLFLLYLQNKELRRVIEEKERLFKKNFNDTRLKNHALRKRLKGNWAFNITDDIRIVYEWQNKKTVRFLVIGTHKNVYQRSN